MAMSLSSVRWLVSPLLSLSILCGAQVFYAPSLAEAAELAEIQERGYLIVAVKENWRPLGFRDRTTGELIGLEIDLARRIAAELLGDENAVVLQPIANGERLEAVTTGEVDLAIAGLTATDVRRRLVNFSQPYYLGGTAFVTQNPEITNLVDMTYHPVAILERSSAIARVREQIPIANFIGVSSYEEAKRFLDANPSGVFAGDASVLSGWVQEYPTYRLVPTPLLAANPLSVALPKGLQHEDLRLRIDAILQDAQASGWLEERLAYWQLPQERRRFER